MMNTAQTRVRKVVITGVFSALVIVLGITGLGFIPLPAGAAVIIHVPVIIAAILEGPAAGLFTGLLFGIFSFVMAAAAGSTPVDLAFLNHPWIAVAPRMLIGPCTWFFYSLASGALFKKTGPGDGPPGGKPPSVIRESAAIVLGAATGSLTNTALVLAALALVLPEITWPVIITIVSANGILEAGFSVILSLAVILPWKGMSRRKKPTIFSIKQ